MAEYWAHSANASGSPQLLAEHLRQVAELAARFARGFGAEGLGRQAGLWHDLGKYHPEFQRYLRHELTRGGDHKAAGALWAQRSRADPIAFAIAGHHGGMPDFSRLKPWLRETSPRAEAVLELARVELGPELESAASIWPSHLKTLLDSEFFIRMLFSALTDADCLDTEEFRNPTKAGARADPPALADLWPGFEAAQAALSGNGPVNDARAEVYHACLAAADGPTGFYRLTVPTGGGKTRSGLGFALRHALSRGLERVITAVPYTSITEQTADVYRGIFGDMPGALLEHHSAVPEPTEGEPSPEEQWRRLAAENWDAPLIVTTTVQLFESLFSNRPGRCRKLHNLARSVIILDEVQTLPPHLLEPMLDALRQLVANYGCTVVLCTATQPALDESTYLKGLAGVREIVPNAADLFVRLRRVGYEWLAGGEPVDWQAVAEAMRAENQALAVVNTKADAIALLDALGDSEALHLSTLLCGAHRRDVLEQVRTRLAVGESCRLVSTQVVEAGVDLDFPLVLRAVGPLDRIVQAAGRCNREGRMAGLGRVVVFDPVDRRAPRGAYRTGLDLTLALRNEAGFDWHDPELYQRYFRRLFLGLDLDAKGIQSKRGHFQYEEVAADFHMIDDGTRPVIVKYRGPVGGDTHLDALVAELEAGAAYAGRGLIRRLQPYVVNLYPQDYAAGLREGYVRETPLGVGIWSGGYDAVRGIRGLRYEPEDLIR